MDSYLNLLSPLDNFNFNHFASPSNNLQRPHNGHFNHLAGSPQSHPQLSRSDSEFLSLLESGQKLVDDYSGYTLWEPPSYQPQPSPGTPWKPNLARAYSDSPLSTSSALSSAPSSQTCSPWETLPALAPSSSPDFLIPDSLGGEQQYPGLLDFPTVDECSANAFNNLSLASPALLPQHHLPDMMEQIPGMDMDAYTLAPPPHTLHHRSSSMSMASVGSYQMLQPGDIPPVPPLPREYNPHADLTITQAIPEIRATSPSASDPGDAPRRTNERFLFSSPSMPALNNRARFNRRKTSRVATYSFDANASDDDYGDDDADGDYEYDEGYGQDDAIGMHPYRNAKRMRRSPAADGEDITDDGSGLPRRPVPGGRKPSGFRRVTTGEGSKARKSKNKKRHQCSWPGGCMKSFTRITDMERHLASVHRPVDDNTNKCAFCRKQFSREDAVLRHENDSCPVRPKKQAVEKWI